MIGLCDKFSKNLVDSHNVCVKKMACLNLSDTPSIILSVAKFSNSRGFGSGGGKPWGGGDEFSFPTQSAGTEHCGIGLFEL